MTVLSLLVCCRASESEIEVDSEELSSDHSEISSSQLHTPSSLENEDPTSVSAH